MIHTRSHTSRSPTRTFATFSPYTISIALPLLPALTSHNRRKANHRSPRFHLTMTGNMRKLVPFFVPGQGDTVNEALQVYTTSASSRAAPNVTKLTVREWDDREGFFRDAVHVVSDDGPSLPQVRSSPSQPSRLLTPAEIRQARQSPSPPSTEQSSPQPNKTPVKVVQAKPPSPKQSTPPPRQTKQRQGSPPDKPRPFAGSSFETASPPPAGIPLPGFVKSRVGLRNSTESAVGREQAAVELKRILQI